MMTAIGANDLETVFAASGGCQEHCRIRDSLPKIKTVCEKWFDNAQSGLTMTHSFFDHGLLDCRLM
jgi:hypothetical protein